eukprot:4215758-Prymnesium_polylepis.1
MVRTRGRHTSRAAGAPLDRRAPTEHNDIDMHTDDRGSTEQHRPGMGWDCFKLSQGDVLSGASSLKCGSTRRRVAAAWRGVFLWAGVGFAALAVKRQPARDTRYKMAPDLGNRGVYRKLKAIGKGAFGTVFLVQHAGKGGDSLVMKEVSLRGMNPRQRKETMNEVAMLKKVDHPHIVGFRDSFT